MLIIAINTLTRNLKGKLTLRTMTSFTQILNPITGQSEWKPLHDDYDYHQEVARSAFADMLHDTERNQKYYAALKKTIKELHKNGKEAHVLDIGTGTGLLSMMAVNSGADSVTACEAFLPMAQCAEKIIKKNGMENKIHLIKKRSTEISVGEGGDMKRRANVLVTEVFDTELIGEGAIGIFNHAHKSLLTDDCVVIPHSSTIHIQLVESPLTAAFNKPKLLANLDGEILLKTPKAIEDCQGECAVHDIQLSQLNPTQFNSIIDPLPIFEFNLSSKEEIKKSEKKLIKVTAQKNGLLQTVFFWWDLHMDKDKEINLSCAPYWAHSDFPGLSKDNKEKRPPQNLIPWRDHWMQAMYHLPNQLKITKEEEIYLSVNHDEYSFWFEAFKESKPNSGSDRLSCTCGFHVAYSRNRIGQINNSLRTKKYLRILEEMFSSSSTVLSISDGSIIGLSTALLGADSVICFEPHKLSREIIEMYIKNNNIKNAKIAKCINDIEDLQKVTHIIAEPYFITSVLPWDNFYFGTLLHKIKDRLNENIKILPTGAKLFILPVEFLDLHKIRSPLGTCEGFDLSIFDELVSSSSDIADAPVEAQPLWEYPCIALGEKEEVLVVDFNHYDQDKNNAGLVSIERAGSCNGIAVWVDWMLDNSNNPRSIVSTGPQLPIEIGEYVSWDMFTRQGVHLFPQPKKVSKGNTINWEVSFKPSDGNIAFKFEIV